jgi:hypothetical protein
MVTEESGYFMASATSAYRPISYHQSLPALPFAQTATLPANTNYTFFQRLPWYKIHGGFDLLGEVGLLAAGLLAVADQGMIALPVAIASVAAVLPDMMHSVIGLIKGDGSAASADLGRQRCLSDPNYVDPQDRYDQAVRALVTLSAHHLSMGRSRLIECQIVQLRRTVYVNRRMLINFHEYPNEAGRTLEAGGKILQSVTGVAAMAYNPVAGALQVAAGLLNTAAVMFDFIPEKDCRAGGPRSQGKVQRLWAHISSCPQTYAGAVQLAATLVYIPVAMAFGLETMQGQLLLAAVLCWMIGYGAKMAATKRGYGCRE